MIKQLRELADKLKKDAAECHEKAVSVNHDNYTFGLMLGYQGAYEMAAVQVEKIIAQIRIEQVDAMLLEMTEVQA